MAAGLYEIYLATNLVILAICAGVGAFVLRGNRKRGALIGAVVGMLVGSRISVIRSRGDSGAPAKV